MTTIPCSPTQSSSHEFKSHKRRGGSVSSPFSHTNEQGSDDTFAKPEGGSSSLPGMSKVWLSSFVSVRAVIESSSPRKYRITMVVLTPVIFLCTLCNRPRFPRQSRLHSPQRVFLSLLLRHPRLLLHKRQGHVLYLFRDFQPRNHQQLVILSLQVYHGGRLVLHHLF